MARRDTPKAFWIAAAGVFGLAVVGAAAVTFWPEPPPEPEPSEDAPMTDEQVEAHLQEIGYSK